MWRSLSKSLNWEGGRGDGASGRSIPLVTRIYLPVFTRNFSAICWAICKLAENAWKFCFVFSALTHHTNIHSYIHSCMRCENKFSSLTHWQLALNLQITCVYLTRPLLLMTAPELFKDFKDFKLKETLNSLWSCSKTVITIGNLINMMKLRKCMLFISLSTIMFLLN